MATGNCASASNPRLCISNERPWIRSTGVNSISKLAEDLLQEILIRSFLNPRFACRSKLVCKRWNSLISSPSFNCRFVSHRQSINELQPPLVLSSEDQQSIIPGFVPMPTVDHELRFSVLDSFQDLLLCGFQMPEDLDDEFRRSYFLCNPFTKQWIALPLAPCRPTRCSGLVARLVCEPRNSYNLDLGDGRAGSVVYSEYRFRVVCLYQHMRKSNCWTRLDMFCSESGEWNKDPLVVDTHFYCDRMNVVSCNGELFWVSIRRHYMIAVFNPFCPEIPPSYINAPQLLKPWWDISVSQGALHVSAFNSKPEGGDSRIASSIWRLDDDHKSFSLVCEGVLKTARPRSNPSVQLDDFFLELERSMSASLHSIVLPYLHPEKPEIVFFHYLDVKGAILSCDLRRGDLEFHSELRVLLSPRWALFHPTISCWPIPIPRYEELRVIYDGSYSCWVQSSKPTTPAITGPTTPAIAEERLLSYHAYRCNR
ncbi:unnamed protein product [Linum trigynum]|uniref:F-box domain-containing protein n=1 Tax=Linum trigynum TaxID=586398 RepID=A0AAV2D5K1_9ROSI